MRGFNFISATSSQQQQQQPPSVADGKPAQPELTSGPRQSPHRIGTGYSAFAPRAPATPIVAPPASRNSSDVNLGILSVPSPTLDLSAGPTMLSSGQKPYQSRIKEHTGESVAQPQQPELEPIVSSKYTRHSRSEMPPPLAHDTLVNIFPEPVPDSYDSKSNRGKLNKSKKTRWSFAKSSPITA